MKKRLTAALCALLLLCACTLPMAGAATRSDIYFMVVNETVLEMRSDTMPFSSNSAIYVPYTMFDPNSTGVNLGVFASYSSNNTVMVYSRADGALIFDLTADTTTASLGGSYSQRAIRRNSMVFLPLNVVCTHFSGLDWNLLVDPEYGLIIRVKSAAAGQSDTDFARAAQSVLARRYEAYLRSITPEPVPDPTPSPPPVVPSPQPSANPDPTPTQEPEPEGGDVYLAFRCGPGGSTAPLSAILARRGLSALFFFSPDDLAERDGEVRALAAAGHRIGLLLGDSAEETPEELAARGNALLGHILRTSTGLVLMDGTAEAPEGLFPWTTTADGVPGGRSSAQLLYSVTQAARAERCFLLMDDSARSAELLDRVLNTLAEEGCEFRLALETALG